MTQAISSASSGTTSDQIKMLQDFQNGSVNLTKNDLVGIENTLKSNGETVSSSLEDLIDSYDKLDPNGKGISYQEFTTYENIKSGTYKMPSLLDYGILGSSSSSSSSNSSDPLLTNSSDSSSSDSLFGSSSDSSSSDPLLNSSSDSSNTDISSLLTSSVSGLLSTANSDISSILSPTSSTNSTSGSTNDLTSLLENSLTGNSSTTSSSSLATLLNNYLTTSNSTNSGSVNLSV